LKRVSFVTLGCKVNQYDTNAIRNAVEGEGYVVVPFPEEADVYVINTCTVTHRADSEARRLVGRAVRANPRAVVIVTGCYAQTSAAEVGELPGVDYVIGNADRARVVDVIRNGVKRAEPEVAVSDVFAERRFQSPPVERFPDRTRAFLKVQDGCNYRCTFCIIPFARGRSRSLPAEEVVRRIHTLRRSGYREVVLTGVHLSSYGRDIGTDLYGLLAAVERARPGVSVRLSSLDPADMDPRVLELVARSEVFRPSLHIALQSGDGTVLRRMRRRYGPDQFLRSTDLARRLLPEASIGTDVIVGFPGEGEKEFENTYSLLERSAVTYFHVFPFSKRRGTPAATMDGQVEGHVIKERCRVLRELGARKKREFYGRFVGRTVPVLVERRGRGTAANYMPVVLEGGATPSPGEEVGVLITRVGDEAAVGLVV